MASDTSAHSVKDYIALLNARLLSLSGDVVGEVSEVKRAASGHVYFTLKDKDSGDILPCTIWRTKYMYSGVEMELGMELLVRGKPEYYGPFGKLSFIADSIQLVGEGALLKAYQKLKMKLEAEGIFAPEKKRQIPAYPHVIGVVTSVHGAVIHDFSNNLRKFGFKVRIIDTRVEGPESGRDITLSVRSFRKSDIDVLVLLRGGGSVQSLAGFDNEALVREIASFPKPVIAGLGHHQDVPLAALAADAMESTPSLVAELLNASWNTAQYELERSENKITQRFESSLTAATYTLDSTFIQIERALTAIFEIYAHAERSVREGITKIGYALGSAKKTVEDDVRVITNRFNLSLEKISTESLGKTPVRITARFDSLMKTCMTHLQQTARLIETNNPERQLRLGYSLAFSGGKVVRSIRNIEKGAPLQVRFADGSAETIITELT